MTFKYKTLVRVESAAELVEDLQEFDSPTSVLPADVLGLSYQPGDEGKLFVVFHNDKAMEG